MRVEQTGVLEPRDGVPADTLRRLKGSRCFQTDRGGGLADIREFFPVEESAGDSGTNAGYTQKPRADGWETWNSKAYLSSAVRCDNRFCCWRKGHGRRELGRPVAGTTSDQKIDWS